MIVDYTQETMNGEPGPNLLLLGHEEEFGQLAALLSNFIENHHSIKNKTVFFKKLCVFLYLTMIMWVSLEEE